MTRYCERCGGVIDEEESFCSKCGKPVVEETAIDETPETQSSHEEEHGTISLLVPTKKLIIIGLMIAALILIPKAIYEVNNPDYKIRVKNRDECIMTQQDLSPTLNNYQEHYDFYEKIISSYNEDIKEYQTKAWTYGALGLLSTGLAVTLIVQERKKRRRVEENGADGECAHTATLCQHCGKDLLEGMAFCGYCGTQIGSTQAVRKRNTGKYIAVISAAVMLLAVCTIFAVR